MSRRTDHPATAGARRRAFSEICDPAGRSVAWHGRYAGERPRKAASRSLGPVVAATVTGAAKSG